MNINLPLYQSLERSSIFNFWPGYKGTSYFPEALKTCMADFYIE